MTQQCNRLAISTFVVAVTMNSAWGASTYIGPSGGQWDVSANWNAAGYPGDLSATDHDARINAGSTVNLEAVLSVSLTNLQINDATVAPYAQLNVNDGAELTMSGTAPAVVFGNGLVNQSGGTVNGNVRLNGSALLRTGYYDLSGGTLNAPYLHVAGGGLNSALGEFTLGGTGELNVGTKLYVAGGTNSSGSFIMPGGTVNLIGTATMDVLAAGSGASLFHQSGGVFNNSTGGTVAMAKGTGSAEFRLSGGVFNANGGMLSNASALASRATFTMSGGTLNLGGGDLRASQSNSTVDAGHIVAITGGTITGVNEMWGGVRLDGPSATLVVGSNPNAASVTTLPNFNRGELQLLDGTVVFTAFGDNSASQLVRVTGYQQGILDLTGGTIAIQFGGGYTPLPGHSFDLVNGNLVGELSVANLSTTSYDGLWQIEWDASQWESAGILTVVSATIPEPTSFSLLALAGLAIFRRRARG